MKKTVYLLTSVLLALSAFACKPPSDIFINDRVEKFEEGATKVTMWVNDFEEWNNQLNIKQRMDFNDILDDGIQLEQVYIEGTSFEDLIRTARETNNEPDIYMVSYGNLYKEIQNGYVADLTELLEPSAFLDLQESVIPGVRYDNKFYAYPILTEPSSLLFYRKDLLQQYGQTTVVPNTWSEFIVLLQTIKSNLTSNNVRGIFPFDVPKGIGLGWGSWGMQYAASGGFAISDDWTESRLTHSGYTDLANLFKTLYGNLYVPLSSGEYTEIINDLMLNKLVMTTAGSWSIATIIKEYPHLIDQVGVTTLPTFNGNPNTPTATNGGWTYVISESSTNKEAAAKVLEYLVAGDAEVPLEYFRGANYSKTSPRISVQNRILSELQSQTEVPSAWIQVLSEVAAVAPLEPIYPWDISISVSSMLENVALGNTVSSEINKANSTIMGIITNSKLANNNPRN